MPQKVVLPVIGVSTASFLARLGGADVVFPLTLLVDLLFVSPQVFRGGKSLRASRTNLALCVILEMIVKFPLFGEALITEWARELTTSVRSSSRARNRSFVGDVLLRGSSFQVRI